MPCMVSRRRCDAMALERYELHECKATRRKKDMHGRHAEAAIWWARGMHEELRQGPRGYLVEVFVQGVWGRTRMLDRGECY